MQAPKPLTGQRFNYSVDSRPAYNMNHVKNQINFTVLLNSN